MLELEAEHKLGRQHSRIDLSAYQKRNVIHRRVEFEFEDEIVMIEVKPIAEVKNTDVQEKKKTADKYCELVSKNRGKYGIAKPWRYVIVPTEKITVSSTVGGLLGSV